MFTLPEFLLALGAGFLLGVLAVFVMSATRTANETARPSAYPASPLVEGIEGLGDIFARAGEQVTCARNGHVICVVAQDIKRGETVRPDIQFRDWGQEKPTYGGVAAPCARCGALWVWEGKLHFADGWR